MHIALIEPDSDFRDIIDLNLNEMIDAEDVDILSFDDSKAAWAMIQILSDLSLIICKDNFEKHHSVKFILEKLSDSDLDIPIICVGSDVNDNPKILKILPENTPADKIAEIASSIINNLNQSNKTKEDKEKKEESLRNKKYKSVPISLFKFFNKVPFDFYIRIKKADQFQFLKRINKNEKYDSDMIKKYIEKNLTHFFIEKGQYPEFTSLVNGKFKELISSEKVNEKSKEEIQKYVLVQLSSTGFNESNLEIATTSLKEQTQRFENEDSKIDLITNAYNSQLGFRFQRNYMISIIGYLILKNIDWNDAKHPEYINMAAYIHDMFLETKEEMDISTEIELDQYTTEKSKKERIFNHPALAADKAKALDKVPQEVVSIVRQHHGKASGKGFTTSLTSQIKKLSILFIVAEEVSISILNSPRKKINLNGIFKETKIKYHKNKDVVACLDALSVVFKG